ncbi:MAG: septum formation inhibitor Maf [Cellvibrionaceae bacterium]|nr:septum formation inhibitor Maf [Cellvibrionaceae bacterium]|tara:strand:+ start:31470 stop:32057 length:588 start_codon:yes stop_codon:yes gene_type:complete
MTPILLASSSPYRRQLLEKLGLSFETESPDIDESPRPNETPSQLVQRLATAKAETLRASHDNHLIIGSDQVAELDGEIIGKPGNHEAAADQLRSCSRRVVHFHTGLCLLNSAKGTLHYHCCRYDVHFRALTEPQIEYYLRREQPYDCAGSFKSEGLGIALFSAIRGDDPNSLIGLPLIALTDMLYKEGVDVLTQQ